LSTSSKQTVFQHIYEKKAVILMAGTRNLQVSFSYIDFQNQEKIHFRYRMLGAGDEWQKLKEKIRTINLMSLDPGEYDFELEATDLEGNWTKRASLKIEILQFFYETIWFRSIVILVVVMLAGTFVYMRFRQIRLRQEQRVAQLKLITIQGQLNPHFLSNSLAAAETFIASRNSQKANEYLGELRDMMREVINNTGKEYIPLTDEISLLSRYLRAEQIRLEDQFDFAVKLRDLVQEDYIIAPSMIQPFAENAIRYAFNGLEGKKGYLEIRMEKTGSIGFMTCFIEDNGVGQKKSARFRSDIKRKSHGTDLIKNRLEIFNKLNKTHLEIKITDLYPGEEYPGTRVEIQIPCKFASS
jgi:hypothetical protein